MKTPVALLLAALVLPIASHAAESGEANQLNVVLLEKPETFALEFKKRFEFAQKPDAQVPYSAILNVDALAGYEYHPKLHANADVGINFVGTYFTRDQPPGPFGGPTTIPYPTDLSFTGGVESAPVKPAVGDEVDWQTSSIKGALAIKQRIPHSDRIGLAAGRFFGSKTVAGGANLDLEAAYLDDQTNAPDAKNGFRGRAGVSYAIPFAFDTEIFAKFEYAWGSPLTTDQEFSMVQISRYLNGGLADVIKAFVGGNSTPRIFVRYYDGGIAPAYTKSSGWEFGIGTKTL